MPALLTGFLSSPICYSEFEFCSLGDNARIFFTRFLLALLDFPFLFPALWGWEASDIFEMTEVPFTLTCQWSCVDQVTMQMQVKQVKI
jgi:hypothetical protein